MQDLEVNTTAMPVLDRFKGSKELVRLSEKLMEWDEAPVTDDEIAVALGPGMVDAFRYTQKKLAGKVRKVTGEPSLCHSADVAIRAAALGYGRDVIEACLLHDVVEDTAKGFAQLPAALEEMERRFSPRLARDVSLLTNRYQLLFQAVAPKVARDIQPNQRGLDAFRAAVDVLLYESDPALVEQFAREFIGVAKYLEGPIDLLRASENCRRDRKFTFAKYLERGLYQLYVEDIAQNAALRVRATGGAPPVPLVVKSVDIIDNVRTSEVSNRGTLDKLVRKAETIVDVTRSQFLEQVPQDLSIPSTISALHRVVQIRLVDQIKLRRRAVADNFSETRFASLVRFLIQEGNRLTTKYQIPANRCEVTEDLESEVRRLNQALVSAT
jgi:hypothetical protein